MGNISRYSPDPWLTQPFIADAATTVGEVLIQGTADGHCKAPLGGDRTGILGVALNAVSSTDVSNSQGNIVEVARGGIVRCIANGSITRGDRLYVATSAGDVASFDAAPFSMPAGALFVGIALESVSTTEDVAVYLSIGSQLGNSTLIQSYTAGTGGVTANMVCVFGTGGDAGKVILPGGADLTLSGKVAGIALATATAGNAVLVLQFGYGTVTAHDASITSGGMPLAIAAVDGSVKLAAPAAGANDFIVGYSVAAITSGATGPALINPQIVQG